MTAPRVPRWRRLPTAEHWPPPPAAAILPRDTRCRRCGCLEAGLARMVHVVELPGPPYESFDGCRPPVAFCSYACLYLHILDLVREGA